MPLILEGIVTTENEDGSVNVSPMGPIVDGSMAHLELRPFNTSTTYKNLKRARAGVFHVSDDVMMLAHAAVGELPAPPPMRRHEASGGWILEEACRWYAFTVVKIDDEAVRTTISCDVSEMGRLRDFLGFNRAKHAVLEAAILATRTHILPTAQINEEIARLAVIVERTAGEQEREAFQFLRRAIDHKLSDSKA